MFTIEIAGIPIAIENKYDLIKMMCRDYISVKTPVLSIIVSEDEMIKESGVVCAYAEQLCIYRHIALALMEYDAFLMHAAVIDVDGYGIAFAAKSGVGKTTRVLMWKKAMGERVKVVNGDKPILRFIDGEVFAFGTPWMGKEGLGANISVQLNCVCFVERSEKVSLHRLEREQIMSKLYRQVLIPRTEQQLIVFTKLMEKFVQSVSFVLLKGNKEKENPEAIMKKMKSSFCKDI